MKPPIILVTGFGAFPGAPENPTQLLMRTLAVLERRLARRGVKLERRVLPVIYDEIGSTLERLIAEIAPDAMLHFGLAARRSAISVETRAVNRLGLMHPDAVGHLPKTRSVLSNGEAFSLKARVPTSRLHAALRQAGIASALSIDAGDYVCNQTFYLSLAMAEGTQRRVGFIHVPKMGAPALTKAVSVLIMALVPDLRRPIHFAS
jgi:pyroglutamyl-peptidase